jgi:hypothetical protein
MAKHNCDPLIYPGLYAPSGFDMMSILVSGILMVAFPSRCVLLGYHFCHVIFVFESEGLKPYCRQVTTVLKS